MAPCIPDAAAPSPHPTESPVPAESSPGRPPAVQVESEVVPQQRAQRGARRLVHVSGAQAAAAVVGGVAVTVAAAAGGAGGEALPDEALQKERAGRGGAGEEGGMCA